MDQFQHSTVSCAIFNLYIIIAWANYVLYFLNDNICSDMWLFTKQAKKERGEGKKKERNGMKNKAEEW